MSDTTLATPRVDIGALAGSLYNEAVERIADAVVTTIDRLGEQGNELNQTQKIALVEAAVQSASGLEAHFAEDLKQTLEAEGVRTWGLPDEIERWLAKT